MLLLVKIINQNNAIAYGYRDTMSGSKEMPGATCAAACHYQLANQIM